MTNISVLSLRVVKEKTGRYDIERRITRPADIQRIVNEVFDMQNMAEENFIMITVDIKNQITGVFTISTGTLSSAPVHPREVFKRAILQNAAAVVFVHNHPSGNSEPSRDDVVLTQRLKDAGELLGISVLDHVVIGYNEFTSLKERGLI